MERHFASVSCKNRGFTATKAVNTLFNVANHKSAVLANKRENAVLQIVHVLILVNVNGIIRGGKLLGKGSGIAVFIGEESVKHCANVIKFKQSALQLFSKQASGVFAIKTPKYFGRQSGTAHLLRNDLGRIFQRFLHAFGNIIFEFVTPLLIRDNFPRFFF